MRLTILGGFLGSGKTTWLRHQLHQKRFGRVHVVVNEAAEIPVDDTLLGAADRLSVLAGGCVCCAGQDALRNTLRQLCDDRSKLGDAQEKVQQIVLETSGLADPAAVMQAIQDDPVLVRQIVVGDIIVAADAANAPAQLHDEGLGRAQIEAANQIVLTKTDTVRENDLSRLTETLRRMNPSADLTAAVFGSQVNLAPAPPGTAPFDLPDLHAGEAILPCRLDLGPKPDWTTFTIWLSALLHARGDTIVRVKGVVLTPAGRLLLQSVRRTVQSPEILPDIDTATADNKIVVIGRGFDPDDLKYSLQRFLAAS